MKGSDHLFGASVHNESRLAATYIFHTAGIVIAFFTFHGACFFTIRTIDLSPPIVYNTDEGGRKT